METHVKRQGWFIGASHWREPRRLSRIVLRVHGSFLVVLTVALIVASLVGTFLGTGPFAFLEKNPMAEVGLFQAYVLMMLLGFVLWIGSFQTRPFIWDWIALAAHAGPLAANFLFSDVLATIGTPSTVPLHSFWCLIEALVLLNARGAGPAQVPA